jgi:hypothetical protein
VIAKLAPEGWYVVDLGGLVLGVGVVWLGWWSLDALRRRRRS